MQLSVVTTLYYSAPYLHEFYTRITREMKNISCNYEIILVNDGSPDNALDVALTLYESDPLVRVIDLSRNFGHHKAIMTGLSYARGDLVFLVDCDLEEPPELLSTFFEVFNNNSADVIYGVQNSRKGAWFEKVSGGAFYWLINLLSSQKIPRNAVVARLMTRRYVSKLIEFRESELSIGNLWQATGFKQIPVTIHKGSKPSSSYNLSRKFSLFVKAVTSFSSKPLYWVAYLGAIILVPSALYMLYIVAASLIGASVGGYAFLVASVWLASGLIISSMGIVAIYLSIVFIETKQRPYTIIRHIYERQHN